MFNYNEEGQRGMSDEAKVKEWLRSKGYVVIDSSSYENRVLDIDCWIRSRKQENPSRPVHIPVSIKCSHDGVRHNNFGIEVDVQTLDGEWRGESWFQKGEAAFYLVYQGNDLFKVKKDKLQEALRDGTVNYHERQLKASTVEKQKAMQHFHIDSKCWFFNRTQLIELGIMRKIGEI